MSPTASISWTKESDLVRDYTAWVRAQGWQVYAETAGWDILLVRPSDGFQIGVEAKLSLNAKVLCQVLEKDSGMFRKTGPDAWGVLVPASKAMNGLEVIARRLGIVVITAEPTRPYVYRKWDGPTFDPPLPVPGQTYHEGNWPELCPDRRCQLPGYVPDVTGGHSAPLKLTEWKIRAIKAVIMLEIQGSITRDDLRFLGLDPRCWTDGWLQPSGDGDGRWLRGNCLPDFKAEHPVNYEEIKADARKWMPAPELTLETYLEFKVQATYAITPATKGSHDLFGAATEPGSDQEIEITGLSLILGTETQPVRTPLPLRHIDNDSLRALRIQIAEKLEKEAKTL